MKDYKKVEIVIVLFQEDIVTSSKLEFQNNFDDVIQDFLMDFSLDM